MKKRSLALCMTLLLLTGLLAGCGREKPDASGSAGSQDGEPVKVESLALEFAPVGGDPASLLESLGRLDDSLKAALAEAGVEVETVTITVGSSVSASGQAAAEGTVDAAVLPSAQALVRYGGEAPVLMTRAYRGLTRSGEEPSDWNGQTANAYTDEGTAGRRELVCTGPSEYGQALAGRVADGKTVSFTELNHARWGLIGGSSDEQLELWLADHYEGSTLADLEQTAYYDGYEEALAALAAGEVDVIPLSADLRVEYAQQWTTETTRVTDSGAQGLGRTAEIWEEVQVVGVTEPAYGTTVAAGVGSPWAEEPLADALLAAFNALDRDEDLMALGGVGPFTGLSDEALDPVRRLVTMLDGE